MRVLHVITGLAAGGAETQLHQLVRHGRHSSDVVALYNPGSVAEAMRADGIRVVALDMRSNRDLGALRELTALVRGGRYDVVHTHLFRAGIYGRLAARLAGVPRIVATEHSLSRGVLEGRRTSRSVEALYRVSERFGDLTIAVSRSVVRELVRWGVPAQRIVHIPNGVDLDGFAFDGEVRARVRREIGATPDALVIGSVGRLHPGKRLDQLVAAAVPLLRQDAHLVLAGEGPDRDALHEQVTHAGVEERVHFLGERPAAGVLPALDVFAAPSEAETFGLSALEAMANGLPVVYRVAPALDELDEPPLGAIRIGDGVDAVREGLSRAAAVGRMWSGPDPQFKQYSISSVAGAVDDVYERLEPRQ